MGGDAADKGLDDQIWYHGLLPRSEMAALLKKEGDWLVRTTFTPNNHLKCHVVSVKKGADIKHVLLQKSPEGDYLCQILAKKFASIVEMIAYFRKGELISNKEGGVQISGTPVTRRKWMIRTRDVIKEKKIGGGAFGEVFLGKLKYRGQMIPVAIKTIKVDCADREKTDEFMREAKLMMHYVHDNVIRFYGVAADESPLLLLMELCPKGSLDKHLQTHAISVREKTQYCLDASRGMAYLVERKKCVHRDLAARNCLLGTQGEVKIADFGLSVHGRPAKLDPNQNLPIKWFAPEAVINMMCTFESDVWSFGTMMWEIFANGKQPWEGVSGRDAFLNNRSGVKLETPVDMPPSVVEVMHRCWEIDPGRRPTMVQLEKRLEVVIIDLGGETARTAKTQGKSDERSPKSERSEVTSSNEHNIPNSDHHLHNHHHYYNSIPEPSKEQPILIDITAAEAHAANRSESSQKLSKRSVRSKRSAKSTRSQHHRKEKDTKEDRCTLM